MDLMPYLEAGGPVLFAAALGAGVLVFFAAAFCCVRAVQAGRIGAMAGAGVLTVVVVAAIDGKLPLPPRIAGAALAAVSLLALLREARGWDRLAPLLLLLFGAAVAVVL